MIETLILSGGGIKGISLVGALEALYEKKYMDSINTILGTSIGSIIGFLIIIGYTPEQLYHILINTNLKQFYNIDICNFINNFGIDNCDNIEKFLVKLINDKGLSKDITFANLYEIKKKRLIISTTCINNMTTEYFDHLSHPNESIINTIKMSIAIPFFFCPSEINKDIYVDGSIIDSFPTMNLLDTKKTLGLLICGDNNERIQIKNIEEYVLQISKCVLKGLSYSKESFLKKKTNIIIIKVNDINILDFNIDKKQKEKLFLDGYLSVKAHNFNENLSCTKSTQT